VINYKLYATVITKIKTDGLLHQLLW